MNSIHWGMKLKVTWISTLFYRIKDEGGTITLAMQNLNTWKITSAPSVAQETWRLM